MLLDPLQPRSFFGQLGQTDYRFVALGVLVLGGLVILATRWRRLSGETRAFLALGLVPLGLDGTSICLGYWKEHLGMPSEVGTPTLDRIAETFHDLDIAVRGTITPWFYSLPWETNVVIPVGVIVMALAMILLRR